VVGAARDALREQGASVHLAHPLGVKAFEYGGSRNDERDAADLADLLRMDRLPKAWIAPPATRELRELVRHLAKLVGLRSHCRAEVHAVLAKCGVRVGLSDLFRRQGRRAAGPVGAGGALCGQDRVAAPDHRRPRLRDRP
jgi:transposase